MRAVVYQGSGGHRIEEMPEPQPGKHQVLIRVDGCGICGSDVAITRPGENPYPLAGMMEHQYATGRILGHEVSGEVVALGPETEKLRIGDRIAPMFLSGCGRCIGCLSGKPNWCSGVYGTMGGYAEYAIANENFCVRFEPDFPSDRGSLIEPLATSLHAVTLAHMEPGARVMVIGAGAVGLGIVHFARRLGAGEILVIARSDRRAGLAQAMGATAFRAQSASTVQEATELLNGPPDIVFEAAGAPNTINQAIEYARPAGLVIVAGIAMTPDPMIHMAAMMKELRIQYAMAYELRDFQITAAHLRETDTPLTRLVTDRISLDSVPAMFAALYAGADHCKVLVNPWLKHIFNR